MANNAFLNWFKGVPTKMTQNGKKQEEPKEEKQQQAAGKPNPTTPVVRGPQAGQGYAQLANKPRETFQQAPQQQTQQGYSAIMGNNVSGGKMPSMAGMGSMAMPEKPIQTLATDNTKAKTEQANTAYTGGSIVDYLVSKGLDHSLSSRQAMAKQYGIDTSDSYSMNVALLKQLRNNEERKNIKYGDKQNMYQAQSLQGGKFNINAPKANQKDEAIYDLIAQFKKGGCVKKKPKKCADGDKVTKGACGSKVEKNKCGGKAKKK